MLNTHWRITGRICAKDYVPGKIASMNLRSPDIVLQGIDLAGTFLYVDNHNIFSDFDRYCRGTSTDAPTGGTGLGMAIVRQIITAHQGTVKVKVK
jgi:Osmosensitive K+ channel histidine kinase